MRLNFIACKYTVFIQNRNKLSDIFFSKTQMVCYLWKLYVGIISELPRFIKRISGFQILPAYPIYIRNCPASTGGRYKVNLSTTVKAVWKRTKTAGRLPSNH